MEKNLYSFYGKCDDIVSSLLPYSSFRHFQCNFNGDKFESIEFEFSLTFIQILIYTDKSASKEKLLGKYKFEDMEHVVTQHSGVSVFVSNKVDIHSNSRKVAHLDNFRDTKTKEEFARYLSDAIMFTHIAGRIAVEIAEILEKEYALLN